MKHFPRLRAARVQINTRAQGIEVVKHMGLLDAVRSKLIDGEGLRVVYSKRNVKATTPANRLGQGAQTLTSEVEIMRGDLVRLLDDAETG